MWQVDPDSAHRILARIRTCCTPPKWSYLPLGYDGPGALTLPVVPTPIFYHRMGIVTVARAVYRAG
jgi:hypothetical protein